MTKAISVQCTAISEQTGKQCKAKAIPGGTVCRWHGGAAGQVKAKAAVRAEVLNWGLGDSHVDPGEVLLRLATQSAARAEMYARLLQEAFDAAERLKQAHEKSTTLEAVGDENADTAETARRDLDRIFNTGGVAALVGNTYGAAKDVGVYVTGEAIRGLADLEAKERERCASSPPKPLPPALLNAPYGWRNDKGWWRWFNQHCEKLIFHQSRHRRSRRRWPARRGN